MTIRILFCKGFYLLLVLFIATADARGGNYTEHKDSIRVISLLNRARTCIKEEGNGCRSEINDALAIAANTNSDYLKSLCYGMLAAAERKNRSNQLFEYDGAALEYAKKSGNDSLILDCLLKSSHDWNNVNKTEAAEKFIAEFKPLSEKTTHRTLKMEAAYELGFFHLRKNDFDAARNHYLKALQMANTVNNGEWIALCKKAVYHAELLGNHPDKQAAYISEAYNYFVDVNKLVEAAGCLITAGRAYLLNGDAKKSTKYYAAAADIFGKRKYWVEAADANISIAEACLYQKLVEKGFAAAFKAERLYKLVAYMPGIIHAKIMCARLYCVSAQYTLANRWFAAADSLLKLYPDKRLRFLYLGSIVEKYRFMGNLDIAGDTIKTAARLQMEIMPLYVIMRYAQRAKTNALLSEEELLQTGSFKNAMWEKKNDMEGFNFLSGNNYRFDSSYAELYIRQLVEMEKIFKTKATRDSFRLEQSGVINKLKQVKINRQYWIITFVTALAFLTGVLLYRNNKARKRALEDTATIALLKEELDHRVKNIFSNINSIIRNAKGKTSDISGIELIEQRIAPLQLVFHVLANKTDGAIGLQNYFETIASSLRQSYLNAGQVKVMVEAPVTLEWSKASKLGLIVNELLTNSFKYAFNESGSGIITIECKKDISGKHRLVITDNGIGLPETAVTKRRGGLTQVKALAQQLEASFEIKNNDGAQFEFWFL